MLTQVQTTASSGTSVVAALTLIFAGLAAASGIVAVVISEVGARRRETSAWVRQEQARTSQALHLALRASMDLNAGLFERALAHPTFDGLDDARDRVLRSQGGVNRAMSELFTYGAMGTLARAAEAEQVWGELLTRSTPLTSCTHAAALAQRVKMMEWMWILELRVSHQIRLDLGIKTSRQFRNPGPKPPNISKELSDYRAELASDPGATLIKWKVRAWGLTKFEMPTTPSSYLTHDSPWTVINVNNSALNMPLAAMLRKGTDTAWGLAIGASLPREAVEAIQADAVEVVTTHGAAGQTKYGGGVWVTGPSDGERLHFWTMEDVATIPHQSPSQPA